MKVYYEKFDDNNLIITRKEFTKLLGEYKLLQDEYQTMIFKIDEAVKLLQQYKDDEVPDLWVEMRTSDYYEMLDRVIDILINDRRIK